MNQPCQRFSGGPQSSRTPDTTFVHVVFFPNQGLVRGYERGSCRMWLMCGWRAIDAQRGGPHPPDAWWLYC